MLNIKKAFNLGIVLLIIAGLFLLNIIVPAYGIDLSRKAHLRMPLISNLGKELRKEGLEKGLTAMRYRKGLYGQQEEESLRNLIASFQRKRIEEYITGLKALNFEEAVTELKNANREGREIEILISEPLNIEHFKRLAYLLPFEVGVLRLRGTDRWVIRNGRNDDTPGVFEDTSILGDIMIHNHPGYAKPMVSGPDLFQQWFNVGVSAWVIGMDGMQFYNTDNLQHSEKEEENIDFSYWIFEEHIPEGGWEVDSSRRYTEKTLEQFASIYRDLNIAFGFISWSDLHTEDLAKNSKSLDEALQSPVRKERYCAVDIFLELLTPEQSAPFLGVFAYDESHSIQDKILYHLEKYFDPGNSAIVSSTKNFAESQFYDLKVKAFEILFSHNVEDDFISEDFKRIVSQYTLWEVFSDMEYNSNLIDYIAHNFGDYIRSEIIDEGVLRSIKLSPVAIQVMLRLNFLDIVTNYLDSLKGREDLVKKMKDMFDYLKYSDAGVGIIIEFVERNHRILTWDIQFQAAMVIEETHRGRYNVRMIVDRIPFDYFHETFSNSKVDRGGLKTTFFMSEGFLDTRLYDSDPKIAMRAKCMKHTWEYTSSTHLPTIRERYLDYVAKVESGQTMREEKQKDQQISELETERKQGLGETLISLKDAQTKL